MTDGMEAQLRELWRRRAATAGSAQEAAAQHQKGRLSARERIDLLFDSGTFTENDSLALPRHGHYPGGKTSRCADGVITGFGLINGRHALAAAQDAM